MPVNYTVTLQTTAGRSMGQFPFTPLKGTKPMYCTLATESCPAYEINPDSFTYTRKDSTVSIVMEIINAYYFRSTEIIGKVADYLCVGSSKAL